MTTEPTFHSWLEERVISTLPIPQSFKAQSSPPALADVILFTSLFAILTDLGRATTRAKHRPFPHFTFPLCNASFIGKLLKQYRETGTVAPEVRTQQPPTKLNPQQLVVLQELVETHNE